MEMNARRPRRSRRDLEKQEQDHLKWIADLQATDQTLRTRVAELERLRTESQSLADDYIERHRLSEQRAASLQAEVERLKADLDHARSKAVRLELVEQRAFSLQLEAGKLTAALAESERKRAELAQASLKVLKATGVVE